MQKNKAGKKNMKSGVERIKFYTGLLSLTTSGKRIINHMKKTGSHTGENIPDRIASAKALCWKYS